ncbi:MAG: hypothetical protein QW424_01500 [Candidatus Bathyarchaeia archaeon]
MVFRDHKRQGQRGAGAFNIVCDACGDAKGDKIVLLMKDASSVNLK